jgi:hypothetical protein
MGNPAHAPATARRYRRACHGPRACGQSSSTRLVWSGQQRLVAIPRGIVMDDQGFDQLARAVATGHSRRTAVKALAGAVLGLLAARDGHPAGAAGDRIRVCHRTGSATNPYVYILVSDNPNGPHSKHEGNACEVGQACLEGACQAVCQGLALGSSATRRTTSAARTRGRPTASAVSLSRNRRAPVLACPSAVLAKMAVFAATTASAAASCCATTGDATTLRTGPCLHTVIPSLSRALGAR